MGAEYGVYVDWDGDGTFTDPGEDVTGRVLDRGAALVIQYGRDQVRVGSPTAPGEAGFELDNRSRDYSPENAASPLAGDVLPGRQVKVEATLGGTTYGLYRGHLDDFDVLPDIAARSVPATCLDSLASLRGTRISTGLYDGLRTSEAITVILDAVGWPEDLRDLDVGATTIPYFWAADSDAYDLLMQVVDSEGPAALVTVDIDGRVVFRDRHHRLIRSASTTVQATFRDSGAEPLMSPPMVYDHGWRDLVNRVDLTVQNRRPGPDFITAWQAAGPWEVADGQTLQLAAGLSGPMVQIDTVTEGVDYRLVSGAVTVTLSRHSGQSVTINITASGGPALIADLQIRAVPLVTLGSLTVSAADSVSISRYGYRAPSSSRDPVWASVEDARAIAQLMVGHRAERLPTVTITLTNANDARLTQQLGRDISDRVHITEAETGLDADFFIERIEHRIAGLQHVTKFGCEMIPTPVTNVFRFDTAGQGFDQGRFGATGLDDPDLIFRFDTAGQGFDQGLFAY